MIKKRSTRSGTRYEVRVRGPDGRESSRTFRTRQEAITFERNALTERDRGAWIDPRRGVIPFADVAAAWLSSNPAKRPGVRVRDERTIALHILPTIGTRHVGAVTPADVQTLINKWTKTLAPGTVKRQYATLRAIFTWAVEADYIARSPCRKTIVKLPKRSPQATHHVITADELSRLSIALGPRFAPMPYLGAVMGLRWGEVAALRVRSIDFLRRSIAVTEGVSRDGHGGTLVDLPKSEASQRHQAAPQPLLDLLAAHIAGRGLIGQPDALLFGQGAGQPLDYGNFHSRFWLPAVKAVGLPGPIGATRQKHFGFHDLRRANSTAMVDADVDPKTAQTRQGHSDIRLTLQVYAQKSTAADRAAGDALGEHFFGGSRDARGMESPLSPAVGDGNAPTREFLEPETRFELVTYALRVRCSTD